MIQHLPKIATFALLLAMLAVLALQIYPLYLSLDDSDIQSVQAAPVAAAQKRQARDVSQLKLFGDQSAKPKKVIIQEKELPKTTLKLTLRGVLAATEEKGASALIEGPNRQTDSYKIDQELPGGALLKQVHKDRVVLERNGRFENLYFPESFSRLLTSDLPATAKTEEPKTEAPAAIGKESVLNESQKQSIKDRLKKLRQRIRSG